MVQESVHQYLKEDYLHFLWKSKKLIKSSLKTFRGEIIEILDFGFHNQGDGPDFLNAKVKIDDVTWCGHVEIHINSADWFKHKHHVDDYYKNVILHVVYSHDSNYSFNFPTLELKNQIPAKDIFKISDFFNTKKAIPCSKSIGSFDCSKFQIFKESLIIDRGYEKSERFKKVLEKNNNDWFALITYSLFLSFGLKGNELQMEDLFNSIPINVMKKVVKNNSSFQCEALILGQSGFLNNISDSDEFPNYFYRLKKEFDFLSTKYNLKLNQINWRRKSIRPINQPLIRLVQLANLISCSSLDFLFLKKIINNDLNDIISQNSIWNNYYSLSKKSKTFNSSISKSFQNHLIINVVLPILVLKDRFFDDTFNEEILMILNSIPAEKNNITKIFSDLSVNVNSAFDSQALIHLKSKFCNQKKCLSCPIGVNLLT